MFNNENLKILTPTANAGKKLWWYYNADNDDVTASGYFKDVSLAIGDCIQVLYGSSYALYRISSKVGNDKTATKLGTDVGAVWGGITGTIANQEDLVQSFTYTAGDGISITSNAIALKCDGETIVTDEDGIASATQELPTSPTANGTYTLKVTVADGVATISWVADV